MPAARYRVVVCLLALFLLSGCASSVYEGRYAWDEGWREAKVVRLGAGSELGGRHSTDCRYSDAQRARLTDRFAVLSYRHVGRERRAVVPAPLAEQLHPGERVYANIRECVASTVVRRG